MGWNRRFGVFLSVKRSFVLNGLYHGSRKLKRLLAPFGDFRGVILSNFTGFWLLLAFVFMATSVRIKLRLGLLDQKNRRILKFKNIMVISTWVELVMILRM